MEGRKALWALCLGAAAALALSARYSARDPEFPVPPQGYRAEFIDYDAPKFPDVEPIVIPPFSVTETKPAPLPLTVGPVKSYEGLVFMGSAQDPPWTYGMEPHIRIMARYQRPGSEILAPGIGRAEDFMGRGDRQSVMDWRVEVEAPPEPGEYLLRVIVAHNFFKRIEYGPDDDVLKIDFWDETCIAQGTVVVEP